MFLDIGLGIIFALIFHQSFNLGIGYLLFWGILFSLLPDLDFIIYKILKIEADKGYKHRDLFHYPLIYLSIGTLLAYLFSKPLAWLFLAVSFLHFAHDSIAYGRGIKWLFPFKKEGYAFFYLFSRVNKRGLWKAIFVFDEKAIEKFDIEHGDEDWIKNIFYKLHPIAIIEFLVFFIALILLGILTLN